MADRTFRTSETFPGIIFRAETDGGVLVDLDAAEDSWLIVEGQENDWQLPVDPLDPDDPDNTRIINGTPVACNGTAPIPEGFTDDIDQFRGVLRVVIDSNTTPPLVAFYPNDPANPDAYLTFAVVQNLRGTDGA